MITNKKLCLFLSILLIIFVNNRVFAKSSGEQYPNISGQALFEMRADRVISTNKTGVSPNNVVGNVESIFAINFNKNWSLINGWKMIPTYGSPVYERNSTTPERFRNILSADRKISINEEILFVEQLKGQFQNEDMRFFFGKYNPVFGGAFKKEKRIGVFTTDFTKDYELREKIGLGITALLENSEITVDTFFNDVTGLSNSAINKRGSEKTKNGISGNGSNLSSYTIAMEGQDLFNFNNLFYNVGYGNLATESIQNRDDETRFVGGLEYLIPLSFGTSLIPFVEIAKINNFSGEVDRNALYTTTALIGKYSRWTASISSVSRQFRQKNYQGNITDRQIQYSAGYKFPSNVAIDVSRMNLKEDGYSAAMFGIVVSYLYKF